MFNAPRPGARYGNTLGGNFVDHNDPLSSSSYDGLDPWSAGPSPVATPPPPSVPPIFSNVIADATVPPIYNQAFQTVDPAFTGEVSVNALSRVIATSSLPASTIDRIVNLVSSQPRVSKLEFFIALSLVALAQAGKDLSIEQVAALASQNNLPEPTLNLDSLVLTPSVFGARPRSPAPQYSSDDPWTSAFRNPAGQTNGNTHGGGSIVAASEGLPSEWWKKQDSATVSIVGQHGFLLNRYMVYSITTTRGASVHRRYSEFTFLWDCLVRRYPFRILPALPPKRINPDAAFLDQRRRGLARWLNFVINHPVLRNDGILAVFLSEPAFDEWRKNASLSLEEESTSKRIDGVEEMSIPSDLDDKLNFVRSRLGLLIDKWQRVCIITERVVKRREGMSADLARLTMTFSALAEDTNACWRSAECELCGGVRNGLKVVAKHAHIASDNVDDRARTMMASTLEAVKAQRDLYLATRDLFYRHDRLASDNVDRIRKRVELASSRLEAIQAARKDNWADEAEKIVSAIEHDQATIAALLARRVFVRHSMWHELRVVLHNRENTLITQAVHLFSREERNYAQAVQDNWTRLAEDVEVMPYE